MASVRDLRRRIRSVQNTGKVTNAMSLVAASKMRRAQMAVTQGRPYAEKIQAELPTRCFTKGRCSGPGFW